MKSIGIKLADGTFYPLLEEGNPEKKTIDLTTVMDNQTKVQVDVYRTETGTLEGAEYVDTLEITNLNPHQNGEPTLCLAIDVDKNNGLSAEIRDLETGKKSEIQVTLASRTHSEANQPEKIPQEEEAPVTISDSDLANAGLADFVAEQAKKTNDDDFHFDDLNNPEPQIAPESSADEEIFSKDSLNLPEFPSDENEEISADSFLDEDDDKTFVPDSTKLHPEIEEMENFETEVFEEPDTDIQEEFTDEPIEEEAQEIPEQEISEIPSEDNVIDVDHTEVEVPDEKTEINGLPDFDSTGSVEDEEPKESAENETQVSEENNELPDFNDTEFSLPDFEDEKTEDPLSDDDFSLPPEFDDEPELPQENEEQPKDPTFQPNTNMFSNLYDKETMQGASSSYSEEDEIKRKTKAPVIICVVCAIICVIAALLVLFVIPSKLNIFGKHTEKISEQEQVTNLPSEEINQQEQIAEIPPEPEPIPAKEDEIVIAETPEAVVPEPPAPAPEPIEDIRYKIVWGDTLWDISNAYYKTPWKYKRIANYNGIKNPDHIISGNWILIPAE